MTDMLERMEAAIRTLDGVDDNLCQALLLLAANRSIVVIPQDDRLLPKPTIMVPQRIYNRMLEMTRPLPPSPKPAAVSEGGEDE